MRAYSEDIWSTYTEPRGQRRQSNCRPRKAAVLTWSDTRDSMVIKGRWAAVWRSCQKVVPDGEDHEGGDGSQIFEEPGAGPHLLHRLAPEILGLPSDWGSGSHCQL